MKTVSNIKARYIYPIHHINHNFPSSASAEVPVDGDPHHVGGEDKVVAGEAKGLGCNSIDISFAPESVPEPVPSHVWSFEACLQGFESFEDNAA